MSSQPATTGLAARRSGSIPCLGLLVAVLVAGCAGGGLPASSTPATAHADPVTEAAALTPMPAVSPAPSAAATPAPTEVLGPPAATLTAIGSDAIPGELGGFTWRGTGSDAPWLVPSADQAVREAGPYSVTFAPPVPVERWGAAWAPVVDGTAGALAGSEQGGGEPVVLEGPDRPGTWSLQVDVAFAGGGRCAYYWRIEIAP